jgi:hypothetical protein
MKNILKRHSVRVVMILLVLTALICGLAGQVAAADQFTSLHTVQGTVTGIATDKLSFTIQNGNQTPVVIKVTLSTWYLVIPLAGANSNENGQNGQTGSQNNDKNKQSHGQDLKGLRIPGNWRSDLGWLEIFRAAGTFSDIQLGDKITASINTDGTARQVLIIKAPAMQQARGTISAITASTVSIATSGGASLILLSNADTKVSIKGYFVPQVGQNVIAVYNRNTLIAQTITIQSNQAPVPLPSATLASITVTPAAPANLPVGSTLHFTAMATYSNGSVVNVTPTASWASSNTTVAMVAAGSASGLTAGTTAISASLWGVTSPAVTLTVIPAITLTSIAVTPATPANLQVGLTQPFIATATYSDGTMANITSSSTWVSSNTTVATVSAGIASGLTPGNTLITASRSGVTSPGVALTVVPTTLSSVTVTPAAPASLHIGATLQLTATGSYSNGTSANISSSVIWLSSNTTIAAVSNLGLVLGISSGSANITTVTSGITSTPVLLTVIP